MFSLLLMTLLSSTPVDSLDVFLAPYPQPVDSVMVGSHHIAFYDAGAGDETILLVHGLGSNMALWRDNIAALAERYRVLALDLPGYGLSGKEDVPATMDFFAEAVVGFLDAMNVERVHLMGVSMGGQIAMTVALDHPERIDRLVLVSPAGIETFSREAGIALKRFYTPENIMETDEATVEQNVALNFHSYDPERFDWLVEQRKHLAALPDFRGYAEANARSVAGMLDGPVLDRLSTLDTPALVLYGTQDHLIPNRLLNPGLTTQDIADQAADALPQATVEMVEEAGHLLQLEQSRFFNDRVQHFLGEM